MGFSSASWNFYPNFYKTAILVENSNVNSLNLITVCVAFYLLSLFVIIPMYNTSNNYQNNKNSDIVYRLQARAKTPHLEGKTRKSLLYVSDLSIDEHHDLD